MLTDKAAAIAGPAPKKVRRKEASWHGLEGVHGLCFCTARMIPVQCLFRQALFARVFVEVVEMRGSLADLARVALPKPATNTGFTVISACDKPAPRHGRRIPPKASSLVRAPAHPAWTYLAFTVGFGLPLSKQQPANLVHLGDLCCPDIDGRRELSLLTLQREN